MCNLELKHRRKKYLFRSAGSPLKTQPTIIHLHGETSIHKEVTTDNFILVSSVWDVCSQNSPGVEFPAGRSSDTGKSTDRHLPGEFPGVPRVPNQGSSRAFSAFSCSHTESECHIEMPSLIATW